MGYTQLIAPNINVGSPPGYCLGLATQVFFGGQGGYDTATEACNASPTLNGSREMPDVAVPVWFSWWGTLYDGDIPDTRDWGHVCVWIPSEGRFISSPGKWTDGFGHQWFNSLEDIERWFGCTYRGFSLDIMPNGTVAAWNGDSAPAPVSLAGHQRQANPDGANRRAEPTSKSENIDPALDGGVIGDFNGWIHGEDPYGNGNDVWFRGALSGNWFYSGAFTDAGTHDLEDLNPVPAVQEPAAEVPAAPETPSTDSATIEPQTTQEATKEPALTDTTTPAIAARQNMTADEWKALIAKVDAGNDPEEVAKYDLVSKEFWNYAGERVIKTFFMSFSGGLVTSGAIAVTVPGASNVLTQIGWGFILSTSVVSSLYSLGVALSGFKNIVTLKKK